MINVPLCCPSRVSILRGQYAHNTQIYGNILPLGGFRKVYSLDLESSTIASWLQESGYRTGLIGKYLNEYPKGASETYVPPGWDEWYSPVRGTYAGFNYTLNENGTLVRYGNRPRDYGIDVYSEKAAEFIQSAAAGNRPFFLHISPFAPHQPAEPAPRHRDLFPGARVPRIPSFNEADVSDKPRGISDLPLLTDSEIAEVDDLYRRRLQSLQSVDEMIGTIIDTLRSVGQLNNTYIVFASDNGFHLGHRRLTPGKQSPFVEDVRVPLIIRGPDVPEGRVVDYLAGNIDLAPTFAEWAGIATPDFVDGRSLVPLLTSDPPAENDWRRAFLLEKSAGGEQPWIPGFRAITTDRYLYVEYATDEIGLYDLSKDPYELENIREQADPALLEELAAYVVKLRRCQGAGCRIADIAASLP
jgi:arylsulfatase A-like enzyme